ncbi:hypothetical protein [Petropleomorpha daqingensis]|uniref:Uncharacterized protein with LGFP repeats n=1 Tax=Petropleomorpha daqingensis TaxID=2026353 RepID=A0A853CF19_9ACTN|nr:uncharacterized protein with LGFP repeats [Petropleomorpha daqingensis]
MSVRARVRVIGAVAVVVLTGLVAAGTLVVPAAALAAACTQTDPIDLRYCELGGAAFLGAPVGARRTIGAGQVQDYVLGSIYWTQATGAHEVYGAIKARYDVVGGPGSYLGFPTTGETGTADGVGRFNDFERGSIYYTLGTGAHVVWGAIWGKWRALGAERFLGYPVTDELGTGDGVGKRSEFQLGSVYWTQATGANAVYGSIRAKWLALGAERFLGYPVTDEQGAGDGVGRRSEFQLGSVYWTQATGANAVYGSIRTQWLALGGVAFLGYPVTDELSTGDGVGRHSEFQRGSIYWTPATGAHEVYGSIRNAWVAQGSSGGLLGYPITGEYSVNAGRESDFQGGFIRWTAATGGTRTAVLSPYEHAGTWVTRFRFSREYAGTNPPITPADVTAMADAGVHTIYLQAASDDPLYPGLLSPDLLGDFLVRAHARGMQVVAWYLPHLTDVNADLARLRAMVDFRASGQAFDAVGVDIEDLSVADVDTRNARLVDLSSRLAAAAPSTTLGAIVLPPVVTDVLNTNYWPRFPWHQLAPYYQVWLPMAYWSNRTVESGWRDAYRYTAENISRVRGDLGEPCAAVSVIGGYGTAITAAEYQQMARAATDQGAVGVSIFDWTTTPAASWPAVRGYDVRGC